MVGRAQFVYTGIRVRDLQRAVRFYQRLGFREVKRGTFPHGGTYVHLQFPDSHHRLELNYYPPGSRFYRPVRPGGEFDHFGFYTPDPEGWLASMLAAGAKLMLDYEDDIQRLLFVADPDGFWLGAYGPKSGPRTSAEGTTTTRSPSRAGAIRPTRNRSRSR
jgi:catechol 2,3-dioxygenase-like lactoylglutathione lyase family enzyme